MCRRSMERVCVGWGVWEGLRERVRGRGLERRRGREGFRGWRRRRRRGWGLGVDGVEV